MKKVLLLFVAIVFFHVYTAATTYYSIDDGNWSNTTTVWSLTSGGTPAGASPKKNDEVYIEGHAIILDVDMTATPGFGLDINATGSLTSSTTEGIMIKSASFFNIAGTLNVNSIDLQTSVLANISAGGSVSTTTFTDNDASVTFTVNGELSVGTTFDNTGTITGNGSITAGTYTNTGTIYGISGNPPAGSTLSGWTWKTGEASTDWGLITNWGAGTVPTSTDNVSIPSGGTQPIISSTVVTRECNTLDINSGATLTMNVLTKLTLSDALINNGTLTINSDATGTSSLIVSGTVSGSGTNTVECYLTDNSWHLVTPSTTGVTANDFYWNDVPKSWLTYHTESDNSWTYNTSLSTPMPVGQGWAVWLDLNTKTNATAIMTGALQTSDLSVSLDYSGSAVDQGWNLIGNPFSSAIDRDLGSWGTNTTGAVYVWNNSTNDYKYWQSGVGTLTDGIIPISQGFFVKSSSAGSFTVPAAARIHSTQAFYKTTKKEEKPFVRLDLTTGDYKTVAFIGFPEGGTSGFDINLDADRLYGSFETPQMIIPEGERDLCINASEPLIENIERIVPLHIKYFIEGEYNLFISDLNHLPGVQIILEDLLTGAFHDLSKNNTYQFSANAGDDPARFLLHFKSNAYGIDDHESSADNNLNIYAWGKTIYIQSKGEALNQTGTVKIYDLYGRTLLEQQLKKVELEIIPIYVQNEYVIVTVVKNSALKTEKIFIK